MFVYHSFPIGKVVRCSYINTLLYGRSLVVPVSQRSYWEGSQMFVYHNSTLGKVDRCLCIITLQQELCLMFVYHCAPIGSLLDVRVSQLHYMKVVRCSYINTFLYGRLLDVRISIRFYMEGCQSFVYHSAPIGKVVRCSCIITPL